MKVDYRLIRIVIGTGVTGLVYFCFKNIFCLVAPFVLALLLVFALDKAITFLKRRLKIPRVLGFIICFLAIFAVVLMGLFYVGRVFINELCKFTGNLDYYINCANLYVYNTCSCIEEFLGINKGIVYGTFCDMVENGTKTISDNATVIILKNTSGIIGKIGLVIGGMIISVTSALFFVNQTVLIRDWAQNSIYSSWIRGCFGRLLWFLKNYIKTQLIIMLVTMIICTITMFIIKSNYPVMIGILIGLLDALPLFGTGIVLLPFCAYLLLKKQIWYGVLVFVAYCICYIFREFSEPRLMGNKMGIAPVIMLITMYVGVMLFGVLGFVAGPIGYIIIKDSCQYIYKQLEKP